MISGNIQAMAEHVLAEAREEAEKIIGVAHQDAERLLQEAEQEARRMVAEAVAKEEASARVEAQGEIAKAELEALHVLADAREDMLRQAFALLKRRLDEIPRTPDYLAMLEGLLTEAVRGLKQPEVWVKVREADRPLLTPEWILKMSRNLNVVIHAGSEPAAISGGLVVSAQAGRLYDDQSFEALTFRHEAALRSIMAVNVWPAETGGSRDSP